MLTKTDASGTRTFAGDSEKRLKQVWLPGGLTVSYKYDALGRRIQRTTSAGADERFVYDGQDVLLDLNSSLTFDGTSKLMPVIEAPLYFAGSATQPPFPIPLPSVTKHIRNIVPAKEDDLPVSPVVNYRRMVSCCWPTAT